ncbi:hypothetical protein AACH06_30085 [Ideonella sp. DXS29W]|uniref:Uncharacterized protein n=1 Tax=Ideonella lacteola TaxID=2984193 RepID=A0ABU9C065_9BURK
MTHTQLEAALSSAERRHATLIERIRYQGSGVTLQEISLASDAVLQAQRMLAAARNEEHAVPFDIGFVPEAAAPSPSLLQSESAAALVFGAMEILPDGIRKPVGCATVELELCSVTKFGYPNDEALSGHPLSGKGLEAYGIFEVINSSWLEALANQNRVSFPNTPRSSQRHFILTFHDSTFECVARSLRGTVTDEPAVESCARVFSRLFGTGSL